MTYMSREDLFGGIGEREENEEQKEWPHRLLYPHRSQPTKPSSDVVSSALNEKKFEPGSP